MRSEQGRQADAAAVGPVRERDCRAPAIPAPHAGPRRRGPASPAGCRRTAGPGIEPPTFIAISSAPGTARGPGRGRPARRRPRRDRASAARPHRWPAGAAARPVVGRVARRPSILVADPGVFRALGEDLRVVRFALQELGVGPLGDDASAVHHRDAVREADRRQTMGDDQRRSPFHQRPQRGVDLLLDLDVDGRRRVVEHEDRRVHSSARAIEIRWRCPPDSVKPRSPTTVS